jgi:hypothetical protein
MLALASHATRPAHSRLRLYSGSDNSAFWRALSVTVRLWRVQPPNPPLVDAVGWAYSKYLVRAVEGWVQAPVLLRVLPYRASQPDLLLAHEFVLSCVYPALRKFHRLLFYKDWAMIFTIALAQKNAPLLLKWLVGLMMRVQPRLHRRFLSFLGAFLDRLDERRPSPVGHVGVRFSIYGKISVTGNAKTRAKHLGAGRRGLTTRALRASFAQRQVRTPTGVMGMRCYVFY